MTSVERFIDVYFCDNGLTYYYSEMLENASIIGKSIQIGRIYCGVNKQTITNKLLLLIIVTTISRISIQIVNGSASHFGWTYGKEQMGKQI